MTGVPDDVLGYWLKQNLLIPEPAEGRAHRRFKPIQIEVAMILDAMRSLGANISVLREFGGLLQNGIALAEAFGPLSIDELIDVCELASRRLRFQAGEEVKVRSPEYIAWAEKVRCLPKPLPPELHFYGEDLVSATSVADIERAALAVGDAEIHDRHAQFANGLNSWDLHSLRAYGDLLEARHNHSRARTWIWLCWIDREGRAAFVSGEDGNFPATQELPVAGFHIDLSRLAARARAALDGGVL
ncbi:MerR family transcriptional regulator [uncultured Novosphingobium sp.]|uniref:MerR family transcriptional regulator n=1 Tax=uncultured Novosphingobium sp. TaxID=292277 RepID=UPI002591E542|nr:MerR family transcriptional regulator [uncultured Novosphingobium sp.]